MTTHASDHLVPLPGTAWRAWRWVFLRGAGFPARHVLELATPRTTRLLDDGGRADDLEVTFAREWLAARAAIRRWAADPIFRQSLMWQNRDAVDNGLDRLLASPLEHFNSRVRIRERVIASYLQRRCVKNDSIGFFGPIGWATLRPEQQTFTCLPGSALVASRRVCFESWAISALGSSLDAGGAFRPYLMPQLSPLLRIEGSTMRTPRGDRPLDDRLAFLLASCDGATTALALAEAALAERRLGFGSIAEVYTLLTEAAQEKLIRWEVSLPTSLAPEHDLRAMLARIDDTALRARSLAVLDELEVRREAVAAASAANDPVRLRDGLAALDSAFVTALERSATRRSGQAYAGRTLVYEDCRRDVDVAIGAATLERLGPPLGLVLDAARWFAVELSRRCSLSLLALHARLASSNGTVPGTHFLAEMVRFINGDREALAPRAAVLQETRERWCKLLEIDAAGPSVSRSAVALSERFTEVFPEIDSRWRPSYVSPDVMIATASVEALSAGECKFVVGEVHFGNTMMYPAIRAQHPDVSSLERALFTDAGAPRLIVHFPDDESAPFPVSLRINNEVASPEDWVFEPTALPSGHRRDRVVRPADLELIVEGGQPRVRVLGGGPSFDAVDLILRFLLRGGFTLTPQWDHAPRVVVDDLVASRETWVVPATVAAEDWSTGLGLFRAVRARVRAIGVPRFSFVVIPGEPKPLYLDLDSPAYVELLAKTCRALVATEPTARIKFSEMLPSFDGLWLTDANGERYTSEIRLVCRA